MKAFLIILIIAILGVAAWYFITGYQSSNKPIVVNTKTTDTMVIVRDSIINANTYDSIPAGFYQGMLPCKSCEGIQRTVLFIVDRMTRKFTSQPRGRCSGAHSRGTF